MIHFLYKTTNLNNHSIYIGVHSTDTLNDGYLGSGTVIRRAIRLHGKENFKREILQEFETREEALVEEAKIVDGKFIRRSDVYNTNTGGGHNWYGMVTVKDEDGNKFQVAKDDPRYLSGEIVGHTKGKTSVKDKDGNTMQVSVDDPRYLSGELTYVLKGITHNKKRKILICPHCGKEGRGGGMKLMHFDNCNMNPNRSCDYRRFEIVTCPHCGITGSHVNIKRYHFDHCLKNPNVDIYQERMHRKEPTPRTLKLVKCPHCGKEGKGGNMTRWHFDNCKLRK